MAKNQNVDVFGASYFLDSLEVTDRSKRIADNPNPEFTVTACGAEGSGKDKVQLNAAASRLMGFANKGYMELVHNRSAIQRAIADKNEQVMEWAQANDADPKDFPVAYFLIQARVRKDSAGNPMETRNKKLDAAEFKALLTEVGKTVRTELVDEDYPIVPAYEGFKLTANGVAAGQIGYDMSGSDSKNWRDLGGNEFEHVIYSIADGIEHPQLGTIFKIELNRTEAKVEKTPKAEVANTEEVVD